ncbi:hypothetical protein [Ensifer aridi]|uniref:hypothetical protein n=1 Tax=Ensifer aridi TaxID=1708715 RepID=UPI001FCE1CD4|nr:hypothetical protein [Ensifer aridi]
MIWIKVFRFRLATAFPSSAFFGFALLTGSALGTGFDDRGGVPATLLINMVLILSGLLCTLSLLNNSLATRVNLSSPFRIMLRPKIVIVIIAAERAGVARLPNHTTAAKAAGLVWIKVFRFGLATTFPSIAFFGFALLTGSALGTGFDD